MAKAKKDERKIINEVPEAPEQVVPPFRDALEREYDSFAAPPGSSGPDHGLSVFIKLHQVLEYLALLIQEVKGLRQDIAGPEVPPENSQEPKDIY